MSMRGRHSRSTDSDLPVQAWPESPVSPSDKDRLGRRLGLSLDSEEAKLVCALMAASWLIGAALGLGAAWPLDAVVRLFDMSRAAASEWSAAGGETPLQEPALNASLEQRHAYEAEVKVLSLLAEAKQPSEPMFGPASWDVRAWSTVLVAPFLLWTATSPKTGPVAITVCYVASSIGMNILNKKAAVTFRATFLLVIVQMLFASVVVPLMEYHKMSCRRWEDVVRWAVVPVAFAGMLATSMWAMREASLSAILILKNFLPIISFAAEKALFDIPASVSKSMILSLFLCFAGTVLYGYSDVSVTSFGKLLVVVNCGFTLVDRIVQTYYLKLSKDFSITVPLCMLLNNTLGIVPMMVLANASGEMPQWRKVMTEADSGTWLWVVLSSCCGACLGYVGLRMQQLVSGTTVLVLQNFNKIFLLAVSALALGDDMPPLSWLGCALSIGSCCWYSTMRLPSENAKAPPAEAAKQAQALELKAKRKERESEPSEEASDGAGAP